MGSSSSINKNNKNMEINEGEYNEENKIIINDKKEFFEAYKSIKEIHLLLNNFEEISFDAYLINTNSIPNFIKIIKRLKILEYLNTNNTEINGLESKLNKDLKYYERDENIELIYTFDKCKNMIEKNNEFIIVDELFCRVMKIDKYYEENKKVNIYKDTKKGRYEIKFYPDKIIDYREQHDSGFYKFCMQKTI